MWKYKESNSSEMSRDKCGHMAAVNSIKIHRRVAESNNININPPDTSVSDLRAAQSTKEGLHELSSNTTHYQIFVFKTLK